MKLRVLACVLLISTLLTCFLAINSYASSADYQTFTPYYGNVITRAYGDNTKHATIRSTGDGSLCYISQNKDFAANLNRKPSPAHLSAQKRNKCS